MQVRSDKEGKNSIVMMKLENLGGTGLAFTIEDGRSIVFAPDSRLNRRQVSEMSRFFADRGMQIEDFSKLKGLKVYDDRDDQKEIGSFEEIFKQESQKNEYRGMSYRELLDMQRKDPHNQVLNDEVERRTKNGEDTDNALPVTDENTTQAAVSGENSGGEEGDSYDGKVGFGSYLNDEAKPRTYRDMRKAIRALAGIMRINPNCIVEKRMPDGSIVISLYGSEADKEADGKMKDGIVQHKKKVAFRMWKNPPRVSIYVPDGGEFKAAYAKGALKAGGQPYFYMPPADEFGGDAQKAFWEAAGDTLTCPILKSKDHPEGCEIGNDHLQVILKAIKDKGADDERDVLLYKMRLIGQLQKYKEYKESRGEKFSTELDDSMKMLEGDVRMHFFNSSVLSDLNKLISEGARKGWDAIDIACAYKAVGIITEAVKNGELTYINAEGKKETVKYDYLNPGNNTQIIRKIFAQQMGEARPEVEKEFKKLVSPGSEDYNEEEDRDDSEGHRDKILQQKDFDKASRDIVNKYSDALHKEGGTFAGVTAAYPKSEVCQKLSVFKPSSTPSIKINDETRTVTDEKGKTKKELVNPWKRLNQKDVPDLSHVASNAKQDYARGRARTSSPTQARGGNTGYTGR